MMRDFLPISRDDMKKRGWDELDFVYVIGDAYVDHPSFGPAIISRVLEAHGYKVGIISQPDWKNDQSVMALGVPRLGFLVSAGNMDSMVNHYTVSKKRRHQDAFTPGGVYGKRPDYAAVVYGNMIRRACPEKPIIVGGIEASLRRLGHYDYWSNKIRRSLLIESSADLLLYGMGERSIVDVADALDGGIEASDITWIAGSVFKSKTAEDFGEEAIMLPTFDEIVSDKRKYAESFYIQYQNTDPFSGKRMIEKYGARMYVIQNPPAKPLSEQEMDDVYDLPYVRDYHPSYKALGGVPAIEEIKFSLVSNRGCFGGCSFCALTFHQGRIIQTRSHESIVKEAAALTKRKDFKGYIHDVGGPTANFRHPACKHQLKRGACPNKQCLFPEPCKNLRADHSDYISLLRKLRAIPKVKKVFIRSGIRFDYLLKDPGKKFLRELCEYHVSGQLKVAPEHVADKVLMRMGKPKNSVYREFVKEYKQMNEKLGKDQYLVPYLMSSHPGSSMKEAVELAEYLRDLGYMPEQVQDFYPTPSTISTCMYYTGYDCRTMEKVYVPINPHEKAMQRALIQYRNPKNYDLVAEALKIAGRTDLIGFEKKCLIRPRNFDKSVRDEKEFHGHGAGSGSRSTGSRNEKGRNANGKSAGGRNAGPGSRNMEKSPGSKMNTAGSAGKKKGIRNVHKKKGN